MNIGGIFGKLKHVADPLKMVASLFGVSDEQFAALGPAIESVAHIVNGAHEIGLPDAPAWLAPVFRNLATPDAPPELLAAICAVVPGYDAFLKGRTDPEEVVRSAIDCIGARALQLAELKNTHSLTGALLVCADGDRRKAAEIAMTYALYLARQNTGRMLAAAGESATEDARTDVALA